MVSPSIIVWRNKTEAGTECIVPALGASAFLRARTLLAHASSVKIIFEQCSIMHMVVCAFFVDGVHCQAEFVAVVGFSGRFNVGQQSEHELWDANDNAVCGHLCHV
jgi:hypothetical protein